MSTSTAPGAARFRLHTVVAIAVRVKKASAWASSKQGPRPASLRKRAEQLLILTTVGFKCGRQSMHVWQRLCASSENSSSKRVGRRRLVSIWRWDVSSLFGKSGQNELHEGTVGGPGRFNVRVQ